MALEEEEHQALGEETDQELARIAQIVADQRAEAKVPSSILLTREGSVVHSLPATILGAAESLADRDLERLPEGSFVEVLASCWSLYLRTNPLP